MPRKSKVLLAIAGVLSVLLAFGSPLALIGFMWVVAVFAERPLVRFFARLPGGWGFVLDTWIEGMTIEVLAILDNLDRPSAERVLFHPDPATDLVVAAFFYAVVALVWWLLLRVRDFPTWAVFLVTGLWAVFAEDTGQVLASALANPLAGVVLLMFVAAVYGSFTGLGRMLGQGSLERITRPRPRATWWWYPVALVALFAQYPIYGGAFLSAVATITGG
jgi:hypothetical protein